MRLLRARIENFRLLGSIELDFATSSERLVTVIRAANESGKTTLLIALQWGLFGDEALPGGKRTGYRLSPLDASSREQKEVTVSIEIDYEIPTRTGVNRYRINRSVTETVRATDWEPGSKNLNLYRFTETGTERYERAEARINSHLPKELREIFFTDGDRALSFIEGSRGERSKRVEGAIRSLLGLSVIGGALKHLGQVGARINQRVRTVAGNVGELEAAARKLSELHQVIPALEKQLADVTNERIKLDRLEQEAEAKVREALGRGNREDLKRQWKSAEKGRRLAEKDLRQAARDHAGLFKTEILGKQLLAEPFLAAKSILEELNRQGRIPRQTIPVLEDQLNQPTCICGESLDKGDIRGEQRRKRIQHLIEDSRNADELGGKVNELFYGTKELLKPVEERTWLDEYSDVSGRRARAAKQEQEHGEAQREAEARIAQLPDVDINQLQKAMNRYRKQAREELDSEIRLRAELEGKRHEAREAERERDRLLQKDDRGKKFDAELTVAKDLENVMRNALETLKTTELEKVSEEMNSLFLGMIGADASQRSIINRAEITPDKFQIVVFGRNHQPLSPSQDLNGASRRALTIAFILALTIVSGVKAPNVIDTPLGMASGYVRTAILQIATQQSSQLVLFLTHDEIKGCEEILDKYAGQSYTLTNPAHYPRILVNDPGVNKIGVLLCTCNHRQDCEICKRREAIGDSLTADQLSQSEGQTS